MSDVFEIRPTITEFLYRRQDGTQEVRYRRPYNSPEALELMEQVLDLSVHHGAACPYSFRHVANDTTTVNGDEP